MQIGDKVKVVNFPNSLLSGKVGTISDIVIGRRGTLYLVYFNEPFVNAALCAEVLELENVIKPSDIKAGAKFYRCQSIITVIELFNPEFSNAPKPRFVFGGRDGNPFSNI